MSDPDQPTDDKYTVFKTSELYELLGELALPPHIGPDGERVGTDWDCAPLSARIHQRVQEVRLQDAVVIRRQDTFASPALLTYAAMISMVAKNHPTPPVAAELLAIADYFQRQGELAGEEAWKLPTL